MLLLAAAVFVGWLMMWVMLPTRTFSSTWAPTLASHTNSTYFGKQGFFPHLLYYQLSCISIPLHICIAAVIISSCSSFRDLQGRES